MPVTSRTQEAERKKVSLSSRLAWAQKIIIIIIIKVGSRWRKGGGRLVDSSY